MKYRYGFVVGVVSVLVCVSQGLAQPFQFESGDVLRAQDLNDLGASLSGANTDGVNDPAPIVVDCGTGQTIQAALATALPGSTLRITGTCPEVVVVKTDRVTLDGQGSTTLDGGGQDVTVVLVDGVQGVAITGLTVQNGARGIVLRRGAAAVLTNVMLRNHTDDGLQIIDKSTAQLTDVTAVNNTDHGMFLDGGSHADLRGTIDCSDNGDDGILLLTGSSARLSGATITTNRNGDAGFNFTAGAGVTMDNSTLTAESNIDGLRMALGSGMLVNDSTIMATQNSQSGLAIRSATFDAFRSTINATQNAGNGLNLRDNASFGLFIGGGQNTVMLTNNTGSGLSVTRGAHFSKTDPGPMSINNNGGNGVFVDDAAKVIITGSAIPTINENGGNGFLVRGNSHGVWLFWTNAYLTENK